MESTGTQSILDLVDIPKPFPVLTPSRLRLTVGFQNLFRRMDSMLHEVLRVEDSPDAQYPTRDLGQFFNQFTDPQTPVFNQQLTQHMFTAVKRIEDDGKRLSDNRIIRDQQFAHLAWFAMILTNGKKSPRSVHIDGQAGSGKTAVISEITRALLMMSLQGQMDGNVLYTMDRGAHLNQQILGADMRRRRLMREAPFEASSMDVRHIQRFLKQSVDRPDCIIEFFPTPVCLELWDQHFTRPADAKRGIIASLKERGLWEAFQEECPGELGKELLEDFTSLISNHGVLLKRTEDTFGMYPVTSEDFEPIDERQKFMNGDFGSAIPPALVQKGLLYASPNLGLNYLLDSDDEEDWGPKRLGFLSRAQIQSVSHADAHWSFLKDTQAMVIDEGSMIPGNQWERYVNDLLRRHGQKARDIFVVAARAPNHEERGIPFYNIHSPRCTLEQLIKDRSLPPVAADFFPGFEEPRYAADSPEAIQQIVDHIFSHTPFFSEDGVKLPHKYESDGMIIVNKHVLHTLAAALEREAEKRGCPLRVIVNDENTDPQGAADVQGLFFSKRDYKVCVISTRTYIRRSLSLPNMDYIVVSIPGIQKRGIKVIEDRLQHSNRHKTGPANFRTVLSQHLVIKTNYGDTIVHAINPELVGTDETFNVVPGQAILGPERRKKDQRIIDRNPDAFPIVRLPRSKTYGHLVKTIGQVTPRVRKESSGPKLKKDKQACRRERDDRPSNGKVTGVILPDYPVSRAKKGDQKVQAPTYDNFDASLPIDQLLDRNFDPVQKAKAIVRHVFLFPATLPELIAHNEKAWQTNIFRMAINHMSHPHEALKAVEAMIKNMRDQ